MSSLNLWLCTKTHRSIYSNFRKVFFFLLLGGIYLTNMYRGLSQRVSCCILHSVWYQKGVYVSNTKRKIIWFKVIISNNCTKRVSQSAWPVAYGRNFVGPLIIMKLTRPAFLCKRWPAWQRIHHTTLGIYLSIYNRVTCNQQCFLFVQLILAGTGSPLMMPVMSMATFPSSRVPLPVTSVAYCIEVITSSVGGALWAEDLDSEPLIPSLEKLQSVLLGSSWFSLTIRPMCGLRIHQEIHCQILPYHSLNYRAERPYILWDIGSKLCMVQGGYLDSITMKQNPHILWTPASPATQEILISFVELVFNASTCPRLHWAIDNPSGMQRCEFQQPCVLMLNCALVPTIYIFVGLILMLWYRETHINRQNPMNYRGPGGDQARDLQVEATPLAASYPVCLPHATEIVSKTKSQWQARGWIVQLTIRLECTGVNFNTRMLIVHCALTLAI